jgi:hypothetical protein
LFAAELFDRQVSDSKERNYSQKTGYPVTGGYITTIVSMLSQAPVKIRFVLQHAAIDRAS